jgi:hypothetical protein
MPMPFKVPSSPNATLDRAIARAVAAQGLWAAAGESGLGRTPSAIAKARLVTLLWSDRAMLEAWGYFATVASGTKFLPLPALFVDVLPRLTELRRFTGIDWSADPVRPELEPCELARLLRCGLKADFVRAARSAGAVWILQGAEGPSCLMSKAHASRELLPCWSERAHAEARIAGPLQDKVAAEVPLAAFCQRLLSWLGETRRLIAPGFCEGSGVIEMEAAELAAELTDASAAAALAP